MEIARADNWLENGGCGNNRKLKGTGCKRMGAVKQVFFFFFNNERGLGIFRCGEMKPVVGKGGQVPQESQREWGAEPRRRLRLQQEKYSSVIVTGGEEERVRQV